MRRPKAVQIRCETRILWAKRLLLSHTQMESTVRDLGVEREDDLAISGGDMNDRAVLRVRPNVCVGCCSQSRIRHDFGNRSYVSGLLIGSRAFAGSPLMGLRTLRGLITGKVHYDHLGRQTLGAYFLRSMLSSLPRTPS